MTSSPSPRKFDRYADEYDDLHRASIAMSGEGTDYFARYKVDCLLRKQVAPSARLLDFGCGIGNVTSKLVEAFSDVSGYEPSQASAEKARGRLPGTAIYDSLEQVPDGEFDAAMLSGVLHHVPPPDRVKVMGDVLTKLRPGGRVFVFEHNPLNPVTRHAVQTCEFDDDAILLPSGELRRLLAQSGFVDIALDYIVFFPKPLALLRFLEPKLRWLPAGAQTLTIGRRR